MQKPVEQNLTGYSYGALPNTPEDGALALRDILETVWNAKWFILFVTFLFFALGIVMSSRNKVSIFRAEAILMEDPGDDPLQSLGLPGQQQIVPTRFSDFTSQVEMLRSRVLSERVFNELNLIENKNFNFTLLPRKDPFYQPVLDWFGYVPPPPPTYPEEFVYESSLELFRVSISILNEQYSPVFRIVTSTRDPKLSADISNKLAEVYIQDQIDTNFRKNEAALVWLSSRVVELKSQLENAERAVSEFDGQSNLISEEDFAAITRQIKGLRDRNELVAQEIETVKKRNDALQIAGATGDIVQMARAADEGFLLNLADRAATGDAKADAEFRQEFLRVQRQSGLQLVRLESQLTGLRDTLADLETQLDSQSVDLIKMRQLQREAESAGIIYGFYQSRLNELAVSQGTKQADSRILAKAVPPFSASGSRNYTPYLMFIMGLFLSTLYIVAKDAMNRTIRTPDELSKTVGDTNILGSLPIGPFRRRSKLLPYLRDNATSEFAESVRNIRTSLMLANDGKAPEVIMATSTDPGEGKTTATISLAVHMAKLGKKTLLVECDIRRRVFASYFRANPDKGISSLILGETDMEGCVHNTQEENLNVIFGDSTKDNAADLFSHRGFDEFIEQARAEYDVVLLDVPPVLAVTDARIIAQLADAVLYVVHWNKTTKANVRRGLQSLTDFGVNVSGVLLSKVNTRNSRYKYYAGGNYKYYR